MKNNFFRILFVFFIILNASCEKIIEVGAPKSEIGSSSVFQDDATATSAMRGLYIQMMSNIGFASGNQASVTCLAGLSSDELTYFGSSTVQLPFAINSITPADAYKSFLWDEPYNYIFHANTIIEGLEGSQNLSAPVKDQLLGEAKFIRAFCHFYLLNMFGPIPIVTTTDYSRNAIASRNSINEVYDQIITDLSNAEDMMIADYSHESGQRVRPNKWAAIAMLARVYLYKRDWVKAELESSKIIDNTAQFELLTNLDDVFIKNNKEAIWQLSRVNSLYNTWEGFVFLPSSATSASDIALSQNLFESFQVGDLRKTKWTGIFSNGLITRYYPNKYKISRTGDPLNEYSMVLRVAEQYLIRAEARINLDRIEEGIADLNLLRQRATDLQLPDGDPNKLTPLSGLLSKEDALAALMNERRWELFSEWGHRWFDLKRSSTADAVLGIVKPSYWQSTDVLYPIPQKERDIDPNLTQNDGYN